MIAIWSNTRRRLGVLAGAFLLCGLVARPSDAQVASTQAPAPGTPGWTFAVTPYFWLATIRSSLAYGTPSGHSVSQDITAGFNDYVSDLNFAGMVGAEARYDRFSIMTDGIYTNLSLTNSATHLGNINVGPGPIDIPRSQQLGTGTRMNLGVWGLAGGYTVAQGDWGNVDVLAGMRLLGLGSQLNYQLSNDITLPNRSVVLTHQGSLSLAADYVDVIAGIRGRFNIPNSQFYVPFYLDVGTAGIPLTWQAYIAGAYHTNLADFSLGYRYLGFDQNGNRTVRNLSLGGALLAATFRF
jgi:hypothetical protein